MHALKLLMIFLLAGAAFSQGTGTNKPDPKPVKKPDASAQEEDPGKQETKKTKSDPEALALIKKAISAQTPSGTAPNVKSFQAEFSVTMWEDDKGTRVAKPRTGTIVQFWKRGNNGKSSSYHRSLELTGSGKTTHLISDGRRFFLQNSGEAPRNLASDINLQNDLKNLKDEIRRTGELMRSFFVANLHQPDACYKLFGGPGELSLGGGRKKVPIISVLRIMPKEEDMLLVIGKEDQRLYEVHLGVRPDGPAREIFHFEHHQELTEGDETTLIIPCVVQFIRNGEEVLVARADEVHKIQFNKRIHRNVFKPRRH